MKAELQVCDLSLDKPALFEVKVNNCFFSYLDVVREIVRSDGMSDKDYVFFGVPFLFGALFQKVDPYQIKVVDVRIIEPTLPADSEVKNG
jgi:hypothetical protein